MKAIVNSKKKFHVSEVDKPHPSIGEVLIKVHCCSINAADYRSVQMGIVPKKGILGSGISGTVTAVGNKIHSLKIGDEVLADLADCGFGGLAEFAIATENTVALKPPSLSFEDAATIPVAANTALNGLRDKGKIKENDRVLIVGSAGGVGTFAIQLAKTYRANVTAICSTKNLEQSEKLGADEAIDYTKEDFTKTAHRYDLILAVNGNYPILSYRRLLTKNGKYVMIGGSLLQIFKSMAFGRLLSLGSKKMTTLAAKTNGNDLAHLAKLMADGKIVSVIEKRYSLAETPEAFDYIMRGHAQGKVIIQIN